MTLFLTELKRMLQYIFWRMSRDTRCEQAETFHCSSFLTEKVNYNVVKMHLVLNVLSVLYRL